MSWRIKILLFNYIKIKTEQDIESDDFNDLLLLEKEIEKLYDAKVISSTELSILKEVARLGGTSPAAEKLGRSITYITEMLNRTCAKIESTVGSAFLDSEYLAGVKEKYSLSDSDIIKLQEYMNSRYRFKTKRKINE
jgi:hypothetical protein